MDFNPKTFGQLEEFSDYWLRETAAVASAGEFQGCCDKLRESFWIASRCCEKASALSATCRRLTSLSFELTQLLGEVGQLERYIRKKLENLEALAKGLRCEKLDDLRHPYMRLCEELFVRGRLVEESSEGLPEDGGGTDEDGGLKRVLSLNLNFLSWIDGMAGVVEQHLRAIGDQRAALWRALRRKVSARSLREAFPEVSDASPRGPEAATAGRWP